MKPPDDPASHPSDPRPPDPDLVGRERELLGRYWHAVALSEAVQDTPVAVDLLGRSLVLARLDDTILAAPDRCRHRGAPLSLGSVRAIADSGDCLVCPYHGLHHDREGRAVLLPARPLDRLAERLALRCLPVVERHGLVWVSLADDPVGEIPDWHRYDQPDLTRFQLEPAVWATGAARVVENFNDLAHFATVHAATFGDPGHPEVGEIALTTSDQGIVHDIHLHQQDRVTLAGATDPVLAHYRYFHVMPFATELRIDYDRDRSEWIQMVATPLGADRCLVFQQNVRNFDLGGDIDAWRQFQQQVNEEDQLILEALTPSPIGLDGAGSDEIALSVDVFTIAYRRMWRSLLS